jgi:hypothetical protein
MPTALVLAAVGCGLAITAGGAMAFERQPGEKSVRLQAAILTAVASLLLVAAAATGWVGVPAVPSPAPRLYLIAGIVVPLWLPARVVAGKGALLQTALAIIIAGSGLAIASARPAPLEPGVSTLPAVYHGLYAAATSVAASLGLRSASRLLGHAVGRSGETDFSSRVAYGLTLLGVGLAVLTNLWQQGRLGLDNSVLSGTVAAILVWSAAMTLPFHRRFPRALLCACTAVWMLWVALALA